MNNVTADESAANDYCFSATNANNTTYGSSFKKQSARKSAMGTHKPIGKLESFKLKERKVEYERRSKELTQKMAQSNKEK